MCLLQLHRAVIILDFSNFEIVDQSYMYKTESDQKDCLNSCSLILVVQLLSSYFAVVSSVSGAWMDILLDCAGRVLAKGTAHKDCDSSVAIDCGDNRGSSLCNSVDVCAGVT
eukprot:7743-Heterococcus_DN1.PRE.2